MRREDFTAVGLDSLKEGTRAFPKVLLFSTLLLLTHTLEIHPSEVSAAGLKIAVDDVAVIHGGLGLLMLYYFHVMVFNLEEAEHYAPFNTRTAIMRSMLSKAAKPFKDPKTHRHRRRTIAEKKADARKSVRFYDALSCPFMLVAGSLVAVAFFVAIVDIFALANYLLNKVGAIAQVSEMAHELLGVPTR